MMTIEFAIGIPWQVVVCSTPKMLLHNYVRTDPRHQGIEADAVHGHCRVEYSIHMDLEREWAWYRVRAQYEDAEVALLRRLSL
jgi:hypothetical protein